MKETQPLFPQELYSKDLSTIKGVYFTRREIDVIACILNGRTTKSIASLLPLKSTTKVKDDLSEHRRNKISENLHYEFIKPRAVEKHIHNIKSKMKCNTREGIIDFVESSDKHVPLRKYYSLLRIAVAFQKSLKDISKLKHGIGPVHLIDFEKNKEPKNSLISHLQSHLELAGITASSGARKKEGTQIICVFPEFLKEIDFSTYFQKFGQNSDKVLFLFLDRKKQNKIPEELKGSNIVDFSEYENYYFSFFEVIKKLHPDFNFEAIIDKFKNEYEKINVLTESGPSQVVLANNKPISKSHPLLRWGFLSAVFIVSLIGIGYLAFHRYSSVPQIITNLVIPTESILLDRSELMARLDKKFKGNKGIQAVAIVGAGGGGKTTFAKQYAHPQKSPVIWEIHAETKGSLAASFESLAIELSKTEEDKIILTELQKIKNVTEKEEKIILFVKEHLRLYPNWVLIYDNVEKYADIDGYFPKEPKIWGEGRIILTTQNSNIQNNQYISHVVQIGELTSDQKLDLFCKILNKDKIDTFVLPRAEETKKFLDSLPPYPLDISLAAYYIKATNIPYQKYMELLEECDREFILTQKNILKEAGDYSKTRYGIITASLQHIINTRKDFLDLLLIISLLDSQNIPQELLEGFKNKAIVNDFIYNLNKYSLITNEFSPLELNKTFSIHRSTQETSLAYLIKKLNLEKNNHLLTSITQNFENYVNKGVKKKDDFLEMKLLGRHCEVFLSHDNLITGTMRVAISKELGEIYRYLNHPLKAEKILKESLKNLNLYDHKNNFDKAKILLYLALVYWDLGDHRKAKDLCEQSVIIYEKYFPENHSDIIRPLANLGHVLRELGHYKQAIIALGKTSKIRERYFENQGKMAWSISDLSALATLGYTYCEIGHYEKAKNLLQKSLDIFKKQFPTNSIGTFRTLSMLGKTHYKLGNYREAKKILEQCYRIGIKEYPQNHYTLLWVVESLGNVHKGLGNYKEAKKILNECLTAYERHYGGKNHEGIARVLLDLGCVCLDEGRIDSAEKYIRKSLEIFQHNKHSLSYESLENLSAVYLKKSTDERNKGNIQQAQNFEAQSASYLKQALEIVKVHFPSDSPHIRRIQSKLNSLRSYS
ncbi:MAG: hypothetical protein BGO67_05260 [Alphaproteobacteria bacterium 41-28]|nr:MAG: hypothetical protein BGO67_05260 [Alphaproteobacteria bacterium 41-28]